MFLKIILLLTISFVAWFGGLIWFIDDMPHGSINKNIKTHAITVLTGGNNRISEGLLLLSQKKSNKLMISGVRKGASLKTVVRASGYKGPVNYSKIYLDYDATTTTENAQNISKWAKQQNIKSIRLVTANYHMKRALIEFNQYMNDVKIIPHAVNPFDPVRNSWCKDYKVFCLYMTEYVKYLGAFARMSLMGYYNKENKAQ